MNAGMRLATLVMSLVLWSGGLAQAAGVGMVLDLSGVAQSTAAGHSKDLDIAASLEAGARIDLRKDSEMSFVFYPTHQQFTAKGPAALQLTDKVVKQLQGPAIVFKALPENRSAAALGFQDRVVPAAMVMRAFQVKPKPLQPLDGETVLAERPEFVWTSAADESLDFTLTVDGTVVHQQKIQGERLELPLGLSLASGRNYQWQIAYSTGNKAAAKWVGFTVASADLRAQLMQDEPANDAKLSDWVLYAMELEQAQMKSQASRIWKKVADQRPASSKVKDLARQ